MSVPEDLRRYVVAYAEPPKLPPADEVFKSKPLQQTAEAAAEGDAEKIRELADGGVDLDEVAPAGLNLLMYELVAQNETAVRTLLAGGADPNFLTAKDVSPMLLALTSQDRRFLHILLDHEGDPNLQNSRGDPLAHQAIAFGRWQHLEVLFERGVPVDVPNKMDQTPALRLAYLNQYEAVHRYLDRGADPDATDRTGASIRKLAQKPVPAADSPHEAWRKRVAERLGNDAPE